DEAVAADPLDWRTRKNLAKSGVVELGEIAQQGCGKFGAGVEGGLPGRLRKLVPRAHSEAVVAAIDAVAHGAAEFARDRPGVFDGEVGDAAARIELVGGGEGVRRADVEAGAAGAAGVFTDWIGREVGVGE